MDVTTIAAIVAAAAAIATLVLGIRNGRPHPSVRLSADPSNGHIHDEPADVFEVSVTNNGATPLRVSVTLELDGTPVGGSLDGPVST